MYKVSGIPGRESGRPLGESLTASSLPRISRSDRRRARRVSAETQVVGCSQVSVYSVHLGCRCKYRTVLK